VARAASDDPVWSDPDCAERVAGAIQSLQHDLVAGAPASDARPGADRTVAVLERLLVAGAFGEALALCRGQRADRRAALFLAVVMRLEARWAHDSIGFADLSLAFFLLRHLIDQTGLPAPAPTPGRQGAGATGGLRILVALAPGETHCFGARILAGELAAQGWSVTLDLDALSDGLRARIAEQRFDVLALSVGHDAALHGLADLIADLRHLSAQGDLSVVLGGAALAEPHAQYAFLGADRVALSAAEATTWIFTTFASRRRHYRS
jgi:hypothetical protein